MREGAGISPIEHLEEGLVAGVVLRAAATKRHTLCAPRG